MVFDLNYSDSAGNVANGVITATLISGNDYLATSGYLNVTASTTPSVVGSYSLAPGGPAAFLSPSGAFIVDNILYNASDPYLDVYGLLGLGFASTAGTELNLWGNGSSGNYSLYAWQPTNGYVLQFNGQATSSIAAVVPEAPSLLAGMLMLLPLCGSVFRIVRNRKTTAI